jgi:GLPGLI family protein
MRYYLLLYVLFIFIKKTDAQNNIPYPFPRNLSDMETIDSGNFRVLYALNAIDIYDIETYDDLQRLEIGTYFSKYYSYFIYFSDSLVTDLGKKHPNTQTIPIHMGKKGKYNGWSEYHWSEYFKDLSKKLLIEYTRIPHGSIPNHYSMDSCYVQDWKLHDDTLTILGYLCQKATCHFRGRNYIAWFTVDIPIYNGPWKFGGLPGLILKVYDEDNLYTFECTNIENHKKKYPIKIIKKNYHKIAREKLLKLQRNLNENFWETTGWTWPTKQNKAKYNPLELE